MHTFLAALVAVTSVTAAAQAAVEAPPRGPFHFDAASGRCLDAAGQEGLNVGAAGPCADLRGQALEAVSFDGRDLRGARLDGAQLAGANFFRADLRGAHLDGAQLEGADLRHARLDGASFSAARLVRARLQHATFGAAKLEGADLRLAILCGATFPGADLRGAKFSREPALLSGARFGGALVDAGTLPFAGDKLASLGVTVAALVAR